MDTNSKTMRLITFITGLLKSDLKLENIKSDLNTIQLVIAQEPIEFIMSLTTNSLRDQFQ